MSDQHISIFGNNKNTLSLLIAYYKRYAIFCNDFFFDFRYSRRSKSWPTTVTSTQKR